MSIAIDTNKVSRVLLADGWHEVDGGTFDLDSYEFLEGDQYGRLILGGGQCPEVTATGFMFRTRLTLERATQKKEGLWIAGPLTAILAVEFDPS